MIGYTTVGTADMERAKKFYCDLFDSKGAKVLVDAGRIAMIGTGRGTPMIAVCEPYDKKAPTPGNGVMVAFTAETKPEVDEIYARAIELGATCDGPPGQRVPDRFYGAYVRDHDGNKLCFFKFA
ncbi:VOC family protein [uncultured Sulfitobacter sp.]|jgi:catechol 2,3-dioxygenase-like lactoylglutathione lyase family enzyme|uniref:VOC family protein n=1 Tax=uncultured Sulfitobacter sp. TaxID=191468 RepID=UPI0030DB2BB0|tara:strand:+ start:86631 stop:87002 length:372 start_codon:yes stop_codon:yes gene_type:complete